MTADHTLHWLLLHSLPDLSPSALRKLARRGGNPESWIRASSHELRAMGLSAAQCAAITGLRQQLANTHLHDKACRQRDWLSENGIRLLSLLDADYPPLLLEIADPPPLLYVAGAIDCLAAPQLAVVGSRLASRQGEVDATLFATELAAAGFVVTSGMALGIDAAAHRAALAAGGRTIAVLGCGIDVTYPKQHRELATAVRAGGALVTEFPPGTPPRPPNFPSRNRIISGLSLGVLVVEAALPSGSLVTARLALEQNREVFALPGSIHNAASAGTNALIRNGATLVRDVREIIDELRGWSGMRVPTPVSSPQMPRPVLPPELAAVFDAIGHEPTPLELIMEVVPQSLPAVLATLGELELRGLVDNVAGVYQRAAR